jgi:hypothetical protein
MSDSKLDWTVPSMPEGERVVPSLARARKPAAAPAPDAARSTLDKLLGGANLLAYDLSGDDPYNATGRRIRR